MTKVGCFGGVIDVPGVKVGMVPSDNNHYMECST